MWLDRLPGPNGIALNPSETLLFVNVTRMNKVWRIPLLPGGGIMQIGAKIGIYLQLSGSLSGPDGLACDAEGGLAVCHSGFGCVWRRWRIVRIEDHREFGNPVRSAEQRE